MKTIKKIYAAPAIKSIRLDFYFSLQLSSGSSPTPIHEQGDPGGEPGSQDGNGWASQQSPVWDYNLQLEPPTSEQPKSNYNIEF